MLIFKRIYLTSMETSKSIPVNLELKWKVKDRCFQFDLAVYLEASLV